MYHNHGSYYFVGADKKWINLGKDFAKAMAKWAELIDAPVATTTMNDLFDRYLIQVVPLKAPKTQQGNRLEIGWLRSYFGPMAVTDVKPHHIATYRDAREAKVRANRELATLSHIMNKACEWGVIHDNPCRHVKKNKEKPRDRYVADEELAAFKVHCPPWLQAYVDLKNLIGLRQQDMLALTWDMVTPTHLQCLIQKTDESGVGRINIVLTDELKAVLERVEKDCVAKNSPWMFPKENGLQMTSVGFKSLWGYRMAKFVTAGGQRFHEHDIRGKVATDMGDALAAKKLLAHTSVKMTEAYIKQRTTDEVVPHSRKKDK